MKRLSVFILALLCVIILAARSGDEEKPQNETDSSSFDSSDVLNTEGTDVLVDTDDLDVTDTDNSCIADRDTMIIDFPGTINPYDVVAEKPVIYLYSDEKLQVELNLKLNGELSCTYPKYENGWRVTVDSNGIRGEDGKEYNYLYWEGLCQSEYDFSEGFCVAGKDTALFLEDALEKLGLERREANEFIVYWLPIMESNPYNLISFQGEAYSSQAKLDVSPAPDTVIRVFMTFKPLKAPVDIKSQELTAPERKGFTLVEWGGAVIK